MYKCAKQIDGRRRHQKESDLLIPHLRDSLPCRFAPNRSIVEHEALPCLRGVHNNEVIILRRPV